MNKTRLKLLVTLTASAAVLLVVVLLVGVEETWRSLCEAGAPAFVLVGVIAALFIALPTFSWALLNRAVNHPVPYGVLFRTSLIGMAVNIITPSSYLGGEPVKVYLLGRRTGLPYKELGGTVLLTKYLEALSFIPFFAAAAVIALYAHRDDLSSGNGGAIWSTLMVLTAVLVLLSLVLIASLLLRWHPFTLLFQGIRRALGGSRFLKKATRVSRDIEEQVCRVVRTNRSLSFRALALTMLAQVMVFLRPVAFFRLGMEIPLGLGDLCLIYLAGQALMALQVTPSGVGIMDGGMLGIFSLTGGIEPSQGMAYLLCLRFWDVLTVSVGVLLCAEMGLDIVRLRQKNEEL